MSSAPAISIVEDLEAALAQVETRSLPTFTRCFPRSFTFYVAPPAISIVEALRVVLAPSESGGIS
jgi:hypothetical protein